MDYEKKYKEALEWARKVMQGKTGFVLDEVLEKFPELKESKDEKIKKEILDYIIKGSESCYDVQQYGRERFEKWIAWLEKQGEQKPAEKVEPKFKVGDWIVNNNGEPQLSQVIACSWPDSKIKRAMNDLEVFINTTTLNKQYHLWTIQDAKDGDVLLSPSTPEGDKESPFIFKEIDKSGIVRFHAALLQSESIKIADGITNVMGYANAGYHIPATKEQRDTLMKAMANAGYIFDFEKKELKKIEQKSAWSEEDERMHNVAINVCKYMVDNFENSTKQYEDAINWLNSLKDRVQPKQEWGEEDEKKRTLLISILEVNHPNGHFKVNPANTLNMEAMSTEELVSWLKSLRPQNWTKEDKERYISCLQRLGTGNPEQPETINSKWFKEHVYPQSTWKPSEEQIKVLNEILNFAANHESFHWNYYIFGTLNNLIRQLKKLRDE